MPSDPHKETFAARLISQAQGQFVELPSGRACQEMVAAYSRFKFGGVPEIRDFGLQLARSVISEIRNGGPLSRVFRQAGERGEHVYLTAPGIRNVVSASNYLAQEFAMHLNPWLSRNRLPTMILRTLPRLGSGRANYASLSAEARKGRKKSTQTLIPASDYAAHPIHVLFLDDVEVTGATHMRARRLSLEAGAQSVFGIFWMQVEPALAAKFPAIEHALNTQVITGHLDAAYASLLAHPDYQPVQRSLRLLLHPDNREALPAFLASQVPDHSLLRMYRAAMANDYLWIDPAEDAAPGSLGFYGPSLEVVSRDLERRGLLDGDGLFTGS